MAIETIRDQDANLTIHVVSGPVVEEEMHGALGGENDPGPTALVLWDMSLADVANVTPDILRNFVAKAKELGEARQGGRTAVVAPEDLQFGLARMSEAFSEIESSPFSFRAFRDREEALLWLNSDGPA